MLLSALIVQNLVLLALAGSFFFAGNPSRKWRAIWTGSAFLLALGIFTTGMWVYPPTFGAAIYAALLFVGAVRWWRLPSRAPDKMGAHKLALASMCSLLGAFLLWQGIGGRLAPDEEAISLASPFPVEGDHCVMSGGASVALNLHYVVSEKTAASYEKHSVDFIRLDSAGFRTGKPLNPKPGDLADYLVYGSEVIAPCAGTVLETENAKPDVAPGYANRSLDGSNYVLLQCRGADVLLAHFQQASVAVSPGQTVSEGALLGLVGNSGNTEEPHLHINAQRRVRDGSLVAVPMRFDGRYLSRGNCL